MCLAIPGQITSIDEKDTFTKMSQVAFDGIIKQISLIYTPNAVVGDYVLVHAGFAISIIDKEHADEIIYEATR